MAVNIGEVVAPSVMLMGAVGELLAQRVFGGDVEWRRGRQKSCHRSGCPTGLEGPHVAPPPMAVLTDLQGITIALIFC